MNAILPLKADVCQLFRLIPYILAVRCKSTLVSFFIINVAIIVAIIVGIWVTVKISEGIFGGMAKALCLSTPFSQ